MSGIASARIPKGGVYAINGRAVARRPRLPRFVWRQSGTAGLAVISMQRVDVSLLAIVPLSKISYARARASRTVRQLE